LGAAGDRAGLAGRTGGDGASRGLGDGEDTGSTTGSGFASTGSAAKTSNFMGTGARLAIRRRQTITNTWNSADTSRPEGTLDR
jgi:hypothetical protein